MNRPISIIICDDHPAVRFGLKSILQMENTLQIVGEAENGDHLLHILSKTPADLVILDVNMPGIDGIEATKRIKADFPDVKILAFSIYDDHYKVLNMLKAGADGYLLKAADHNEIIEAVHKLMNGSKYVSKDLADKVIFSAIAGTEKEGSSQNKVLSKREEEILSLLSNDYSYEEIARKLKISRRTVDTHRYNISKKLGIRSIAGLIRYAISHGLV
ncbi:MAG: DNA-binding response regulator [Chitinophagales bacterium]|nr:MAG: DNA-binding response regulator [Chitinophagales bacterium]